MERTITITMSDMKGIMKSLIREAIAEFASTLNIPVTLSDLENDNHTALLQITDLDGGGHAITINDGGNEWWRILTSYDTMTIKDMGFLNQDTTMIHDGIITIGSSSITPLTSHQSLDHLQLKIDAEHKLSYDLLSDKPALFSGNYSDLTNKPTIPSVSLSDGIISINGSTIKPITSHQSLADYLKVSTASVTYQTKIDSDHKLNYSFLTGTPTIPTKVSDLTNDSGFLTSHQSLSHLQPKIDANNKLAYTLLSGVPTKVSQFTNDSGFTSYSDADVIAKLKADGLLTNDNKLAYSKLDNAPNSLPASDVYSWAKEASKPTYTASEVGARPDNWMPTASQVGARPSTWMPSASDVGARPST